MPETFTRLDMSMMLAMHRALRRDLTNLAALAKRGDDDLAKQLRAATGWQLFRDFLHVHHSAEDETLWPTLHESVQGSPAALEVLAAMEAEHEAIDPLLRAIDDAIRGQEDGTLRDLIAELEQVVGGHLTHEEQEALPLIDATLTEEQWRRFGADHRAKIGSQASLWIPWILDGALPEHADLILSRLPGQARADFHEQWLPAYLGLNLWGSRDGAAVP